MGDGLKVLIVEDEALIGVSLEKVLSKMGYNTLNIARTGEEAISLAFSHHPDVILMDIRIKGDMDGIEASERINSEMSIPVIFLTAYSDDQYIERCVKTGSYGFLSKPAGSQEIKAAIEIAVSRHRALKAEEGMEKRDAILKAVGFAAAQFLSNPSFRDGIRDTLLNFGKTEYFESISLFRNIYNSEGNLFMRPFCFWTPPENFVVPENDSFFPYSAVIPGLDDIMGNKNTYLGNSGDLELKTRELMGLGSQGSFLVVPVFANDDWWGFICFESLQRPENWSEGEKDGICAAATLIGSAISHGRLNQEIVENEEKYRSLYNLVRMMCDNVPDTMWAQDKEGKYTFVNRTFCEDVLGVNDTDEPLKKDIHHYIRKRRLKNPDDPVVALLEEYEKSSFKGINKPFQSVYRVEIGGNDLYYDVYRAPFYDYNGKHIGSVGCARNITREKNYENSLLEVNARFTAFMDQLPACAYISSRAGKILYANQYAKDLFGEEDLGSLFIPYKINEEISGDPDDAWQKIQNNRHAPDERTYKLKNGSIRTLKFILFPISGGGIEDATGAIALDVTETRQAGLKLAESEQKYRLLFENANDAIYVSNGEFCTDCNDKLCRLLGYDRDEIIGKCLTDFSPEYQPDGIRSRDKLREFLMMPDHGDYIEIFDWQAVKKTGELIDTRVSINSAEACTQKHLYLILRDITDEKKAENALKESEERYRSLVDNSPIGIEIFQDGKIVYASPVLEEMLCYSREDIIEMPFEDLIHPDDLGFVFETNRRRLEGYKDVPKNYKLRIIDGHGDIKIIDVNVVLIEWNKRPATLNFLLDITEKEKYEIALKESEERYRGVVENARINILITQDGEICYANPSTAHFLGIAKEDLVFRSFTDFIHEDDREKVINYHYSRLSGGDYQNLPEKYMIRAYNYKGEVRTLDFNTTVIRWKGKPATLNFLVDITDQIESTELIEKALLEKTILLQEVHHRVKNNLALINSLLSMQARNARNKDVIASLRDAETRIFSIAAVHEGLYRSQSISTIPAGEHFRALGDEIISNYAPDVRIKFDVNAFECELGLNMAIPVSLVVNELLTNSIKYAFSGRDEGRIYINAACDNESLNLVVGDDGVGIQKDFDLDSTESLGMTLVRNIVEMQLEGTIRLDRGDGTRWIINLPRPE